MRDEPTEDNIKELLNKMPKDSTAVERLILANSGTVQTLLSVLFNVPIEVEVISQIEETSYIIRWSKLVAKYSDEVKFTVCLAESIINRNTNYSGFLNGIREKRMGIGQLLSSIKVRTNREILGFHSDNSVFTRTYSIKSEEEDINSRPISIIITEVFPRDVFNKIE